MKYIKRIGVAMIPTTIIPPMMVWWAQRATGEVISDASQVVISFSTGVLSYFIVDWVCDKLRVLE